MNICENQILLTFHYFIIIWEKPPVFSIFEGNDLKPLTYELLFNMFSSLMIF